MKCILSKGDYRKKINYEVHFIRSKKSNSKVQESNKNEEMSGILNEYFIIFTKERDTLHTPEQTCIGSEEDKFTCLVVYREDIIKHRKTAACVKDCDVMYFDFIIAFDIVPSGRLIRTAHH